MRGSLWLGGDGLEQLADGVRAFERVSERAGGDDPVAIATTLARLLEVAARRELGDDALGRALSDADTFGDVANPEVGVVSEAHEHVRVVGQEGPFGHGPTVRRTAPAAAIFVMRIALHDIKDVYCDAGKEVRP